MLKSGLKPIEKHFSNFSYIKYYQIVIINLQIKNNQSLNSNFEVKNMINKQ